MDYNPPFGSTDPNAPYVDRNTPGAVAGSRVPAGAIEDPQREIVHVIEEAGLEPDPDDLTQLAQAIRALSRGSSQVFSNPGTFNWVCPAGVNRVKARLWGAGGGGGGAKSTTNSLATGGGGGGYAERIIDTVPGQTYVISVGAGGAAGNASPTAGGAGGFSSFANIVTALGGTGGQAADGVIQTAIGQGGTSSGATFGVPGGGSGIGWISAEGAGGRNVSAQGGNAFQTANTAVAVSAAGSSLVGNAGTFPGGGGGGGVLGAAGGAGSRGLVILEY